MLRKHASTVVIASLALWSPPAWSDPNATGGEEAASCASAYEQAQEARSGGRLREARENLDTCVRPHCPEFIRADCDRWLVEVESALPSVVLGAKRDGVDVSDVKVLFDDELLVERLDGRALSVDPGRHKLTFVGVDDEQVVVDVVIREGEKNRPIVATFEPAPSRPSVASTTTTTAPAQEPEKRGPLPFVMAGVGVLGIGGFAVLGALGNKEKTDREDDCAPNCADSEVASVRTKYVLADVSLGVGIVALGVAGYLYFVAPQSKKAASRSRGPALDVAVSGHGAFGTVRTHF